MQNKILNPLLSKKIDLLPNTFGSYQMKNKDGDIIYVGKAKSLKKRVSQYFFREQFGKVQRMVDEIEDFEFIETQSEQEALLLEINLIHKYRPKYNIALMDDKSYPYICLFKKADPYLKIVRKNNEKNCIYFGPYPDSSKAHKMLQLLYKLFPLRKCKTLPNKPCLYYYLNQCLGPCINKVNPLMYQQIIDEVTSFLNGDTSSIINKQKDLMKEYADTLQFEKANECKELIDTIEKITTQQKIVFSDKTDRDVLGYSTRDGYICILFLIYKKGILFDRYYKILDLEDDIESLIERIIVERYSDNTSKPKELIVPLEEIKEVLNNFNDIKIIKPTRGIKFDLLSLALKNASMMLDTHFQTARLEDDVVKLLDELKEKLSLNKTPLDIELYDNSHLQGFDPVGVMVKYINGVKATNHYRKYKITNDNSKDDLASMNEVLTRRFERAIKENEKLPDLILMDGGEEQCKIACRVMEKLNLNISIAGLKKNDKHQTSILLNATTGEEIDLDRKSPLFFLLTRMQDEVHRFAITFHQSKRSKAMFKTIFDDVDGIGNKRKVKLLEAYPTIELLENAPKEELLQIIPEDVINRLFEKIKEVKKEKQSVK